MKNKYVYYLRSRGAMLTASAACRSETTHTQVRIKIRRAEILPILQNKKLFMATQWWERWIQWNPEMGLFKTDPEKWVLIDMDQTVARCSAIFSKLGNSWAPGRTVCKLDSHVNEWNVFIISIPIPHFRGLVRIRAT